MSSRTVLSTSCNCHVALATGIFNPGFTVRAARLRGSDSVPINTGSAAHAHKSSIIRGRRVWRLRLLSEGHRSAGLEHQGDSDLDTIHRYLNGEGHRLGFCLVRHTKSLAGKGA
jgi:hypothetical protein